MRSVLVEALDSLGGQCSALYPEKPIYDVPAYPKINAGDLIEKLKEQAAPFDPVYIISERAEYLDRSDEFFKITTSSGRVIESKIILIACGAGAFGPNVPPIKNIGEFEGKSVFYSVTDKSLFKGRGVVIAGGGDSAVDWALSLSEITKKLYLVHRRDKFRAAPGSVNLLYEASREGRIELLIGYGPDSLGGTEGRLEYVGLKDLEGKEKLIETDFFLPFFGLKQDIGPIGSFGLEIERNCVKVKPPYFRTGIDGIYAAGDGAAYEGKLKLILTGFAEVASALHDAYGKVFDGKALHFEYSTSKGIGEGGGSKR